MEYSDFGNSKELKLPPPSYGQLKGDAAKEHAKKVRDVLDSKAMYEHPYWRRRHRLWRKADLFKQVVQWLRDSFNDASGSTLHYSPMEFRENDPNYIPTPVYDEFSQPINNEAARLGRPEYKPYVRPRGERPDVKVRTGAKRGQEVLEQSLEDMRWAEQESLFDLHMPLYGGSWLKSYWDFSWEKTTRIPVEGALKCPACNFKLSSPEVSAEEAAPHMEGKPGAFRAMPGTDPDAMPAFSVSHCLTCEPTTETKQLEPEVYENGEVIQQEETVEVPPPMLEPFTPVDEELDGQDFFQRPLGEDVPLGEWKMRIPSVYDVFPDNLGIDQQPDSMREWLEIHVESLDWVADRYDSTDVKPEKPSELMKYHPICGERSLYQGSGLHGAKLFRNHVRVKEYHRKPWREVPCDMEGVPIKGQKPKKNKGRSIVMAGDVLLFDGDYLMESTTNKGRLIPRVHMDYVPFELRSGGRELHGVSLSERMFDAQENINEVKSQIQDARIQEGSPKWLLTRGSNLDYERSGTAGSQWYYDPDMSGAGHKPERIQSELLDSAVYQEINSDQSYIARASSMTETEQGVPPAGVTAALALQFLQEQSGEIRKERLRRKREALQRAYSHGLLLCHELVREPRQYWIRGEDGSWSEKTWTGLELQGQTDVRIDPEPEHETDLQKQQRLLDAITQKLINPADPKVARRVARKLHVDEEIFQEDNLQEEAAGREFCEFLDYSKEPVVDDDMDSHKAHYDQHGADCMGEKFRDLEEAAGWDKALPYLSDWRQVFFPQPNPVQQPPDPMTGMAPPPAMMPGLDQKLKAPNPQTGEPGIPSLELRIMKTWMLLLGQAQYQPGPSEQEALGQVMRFRAHMAAHRVLGETQQQAAATGASVMAAPESPDQTLAGTVPTAQGQGAMVEA